jgi:protein TonB
MGFKRIVGAHLAAFLLMLLVSPATFGLVIAMNKFLEEPEADDVKGPTVFTPEPKKEPKRKPPKPEAVKVERARRAPAPAAPAAPPDLGGGTDVGDVEFVDANVDTSDLSGLANRILGDPVESMEMTADSVDTKPVQLSGGEPQYPLSLRKRGITGRVVVHVLIGTDGNVKRIRLVETAPVGESGKAFENAVVAAIKHYRFKPALYKSQPTEMWAEYEFQFET